MLPMREEKEAGRRELAMGATVAGAVLLALLPVVLAFAGSAWQPGRKSADSIVPLNPKWRIGRGELVP